MSIQFGTTYLAALHSVAALRDGFPGLVSSVLPHRIAIRVREQVNGRCPFTGALRETPCTNAEAIRAVRAVLPELFP